MEIVKLKLSALEPNTGQVPGLPINPRQWTKSDVDSLARSLAETPELFEARPLLVVPHEGKYVILGGNLRYEASKQNKAKEVPCVVFSENTEISKLKELVLKDNSSFGDWDFDALANEWSDLPLTDWGIPAWDPEVGEGGAFEPTIEDGEREGADYENAKMVFQFTAQEFAFVSDVLAGYDSNKEAALLMVLGYEGPTEE